MQALLHAVGLGTGAIPMAAALNWIIKVLVGVELVVVVVVGVHLEWYEC